ncbi:MAG: DUF1292 domain-containing protein [Clostridia bacterium]|nr:DUF1292 domain-containing protein [Clostridia bacterium]
MEKNPIDKIFDENDSDPIILYNETGQQVAFEQIALIPLDGRVYVILQPIELLEGMADDEALVFEILQHDGEDVLTIVFDEEIIDAVFDAYYALLDESEE